jgi:hypothetical protein
MRYRREFIVFLFNISSSFKGSYIIGYDHTLNTDHIFCIFDTL